MIQPAASAQHPLSVKDMVTTGIYCALFYIATMVGGILFAPNPVLTFLTPMAVALVAGPIYLLLSAKVPKRGPILILGVVMALLMFVTGMYWLWSVAYILLAVAAELIAGSGGYRSQRRTVLGYVVFSLNPIASYMMLWINRQAYAAYLMSKGTEQTYMDTMLTTAQGWMLPAMVLATALCAWLGALLGKHLLKKQFEKAGIV